MGLCKAICEESDNKYDLTGLGGVGLVAGSGTGGGRGHGGGGLKSVSALASL